MDDIQGTVPQGTERSRSPAIDDIWILRTRRRSEVPADKACGVPDSDGLQSVQELRKLRCKIRKGATDGQVKMVDNGFSWSTIDVHFYDFPNTASGIPLSIYVRDYFHSWIMRGLFFHRFE